MFSKTMMINDLSFAVNQYQMLKTLTIPNECRAEFRSLLMLPKLWYQFDLAFGNNKKPREAGHMMLVIKHALLPIKTAYVVPRADDNPGLYDSLHGPLFDFYTAHRTENTTKLYIRFYNDKEGQLHCQLSDI